MPDELPELPAWDVMFPYLTPEPGARWMLVDPTPRRGPWLPDVTALEGADDGLYVLRFSHARLVPCLVRDGTPAIVPVHQLPGDTPARWVDDPVPLAPPASSSIAWAEPPVREDGVVRGVMEINELVDTADGARWRPRAPVTLTADGALDVDGRLQGRFDTPLRFRWTACEDPVAAKFGQFLEHDLDLLARLRAGGPAYGGEDRVAQLFRPTGFYKWWAVEDVVAHADETVPVLLKILDGVLADPDAEVDAHDMSVRYALSLLAHLRVREAHTRIVWLARLGYDTLVRHIGDHLLESLHAALVRTAGDDVSQIEALLDDGRVDGLIRAEAAVALSDAALLGTADRTAVLKRLIRHLLPGAGQDRAGETARGVVYALAELGVPELEPLIRFSIAEGIVDESGLLREGLEYMLNSGEPDRVGRALAGGDDPHIWMRSAW